MKTFVTVVIDQLGWADRDNLKYITKRLGQPARVLTPYFPTVTETAHASLGTGSLPCSHGVIGSETLTGRDLRHCRIRESIYVDNRAQQTTSRLEVLEDQGVQVFVVAGKENVAKLVDPRPNFSGPGVRVTYETDQMTEALALSVLDEYGHQADPVWQLDTAPFPNGRRDPCFDSCLIEIARLLLRNARDPGRDAFLFLGLPYLDVFGHDHTRANPDFATTIQKLDARLDKFLNEIGIGQAQNAGAVVTGDHGCRDVIAAVWPDSTNRMRYALSLGRTGVLSLPTQELLTFFDEDGVERPAILFDGGTVRLWTKDGCADAVTRFLNNENSEWSAFLETAVIAKDLTACIRQVDASRHDNWGHVVGIAKRNVALCKRSWMDLSQDGNAKIPRGEHGTDCDEDREVPWWGQPDSHHTLIEAALAFFVGQTPQATQLSGPP